MLVLNLNKNCYSQNLSLREIPWDVESEEEFFQWSHKLFSCLQRFAGLHNQSFDLSLQGFPYFHTKPWLKAYYLDLDEQYKSHPQFL